jgi:transcriptional regulator of met regulon
MNVLAEEKDKKSKLVKKSMHVCSSAIICDAVIHAVNHILFTTPSPPPIVFFPS